MRSVAWFIVSELLLVLVLVLIFSNWHGSANISLAWPLSGCTLTITGAAQGGRILLAFLAAILTVATFIVGFIRMFTRPKSGKPGPNRQATAAPPQQQA